jgi:hypothetical protein
MLQNLAAWRKQRRLRGNGTAERQEIVFIAAGAMQKEQWNCLSLGTRLEAVNECRGEHHASTPSGGNSDSISFR